MRQVLGLPVGVVGSAVVHTESGAHLVLRTHPSWLPWVTVPDATANGDIAAMERWEPPTAPPQEGTDPAAAAAAAAVAAEVELEGVERAPTYEALCAWAVEAAEAEPAAARQSADRWIWGAVGNGLLDRPVAEAASGLAAVAVRHPQSRNSAPPPRLCGGFCRKRCCGVLMARVSRLGGRAAPWPAASGWLWLASAAGWPVG